MKVYVVLQDYEDDHASDVVGVYTDYNKAADVQAECTYRFLVEQEVE